MLQSSTIPCLRDQKSKINNFEVTPNNSTDVFKETGT